MQTSLGHEKFDRLSNHQASLGKWWIDDDGGWHRVLLEHPDPSQSRPLPANLEMEAMAFRHLGLVKVFRVGGHVRAKWDLRLVAEKAIAALMESLCEAQGIKKVTLYFYVDGWCKETLMGASAGVQRIDQVQRYRTVAAVLDPQARELNIDLAKQANPLLRLGMQAWRESGGRLDDLWRDGAKWLLDRSLVVAHSGRGGQAGLRIWAAIPQRCELSAPIGCARRLATPSARPFRRSATRIAWPAPTTALCRRSSPATITCAPD